MKGKSVGGLVAAGGGVLEVECQAEAEAVVVRPVAVGAGRLPEIEHLAGEVVSECGSISCFYPVSDKTLRVKVYEDFVGQKGSDFFSHSFLEFRREFFKRPVHPEPVSETAEVTFVFSVAVFES